MSSCPSTELPQAVSFAWRGIVARMRNSYFLEHSFFFLPCCDEYGIVRRPFQSEISSQLLSRLPEKLWISLDAHVSGGVRGQSHSSCSVWGESWVQSQTFWRNKHPGELRDYILTFGIKISFIFRTAAVIPRGDHYFRCLCNVVLTAHWSWRGMYFTTGAP